MNIKIIKSEFHRNGICGAGFKVSIFEWDDGGVKRTMVGIRFDEAGHTAVFDLKMLSKQNIEFGMGNSWRGDHFEPELPAPNGQVFSPIPAVKNETRR